MFCVYTVENKLTRALNWEPVTSAFLLVIEDGAIRDAWEDTSYGYPDGEWDVFLQWMWANHPADYERLYDPQTGYANLDSASIQLWLERVDEFAASPEAVAQAEAMLAAPPASPETVGYTSMDAWVAGDGRAAGFGSPDPRG